MPRETRWAMSTTVDQAVERQLREVLPVLRKLRTGHPSGPRPRTPDLGLSAISQIDQMDAFVESDLPMFELTCSVVSSVPLIDARLQAVCLEVWNFGVPMVSWICLMDWGKSLPDTGKRLEKIHSAHQTRLADAKPRYIAAMTQLAVAWLTPRFAEEPRNEIRKRVADLRPAYESAELIELMGKNTEGMLTPVERNEFLRLHKFFEMLQDIVDTALYPNPAES